MNLYQQTRMLDKLAALEDAHKQQSRQLESQTRQLESQLTTNAKFLDEICMLSAKVKLLMEWMEANQRKNRQSDRQSGTSSGTSRS